MREFAVTGRTVSTRREGVTLLELSVAVAVLLIVASSLNYLFASMSSVSNDIGNTMDATHTSHRALRRLFEDLQSVKTTGVDSTGVPYFRIGSVDGGTDNLASYRRLVGYRTDPQSGAVLPVYSSQVDVFVDAEGSLVRVESGEAEVLAQRAGVVRFQLEESGMVVIELTTRGGSGVHQLDFNNSIFVLPGNG